ncbi:MAG: hypothetical protein E7371_00875 [Clostridiales bacterium]|nr:hypothetical protein [Clostridiales bacterium]
MKVKSGKSLWLLAILCILCTMIFVACKGNDNPDYYFSISTDSSVEEVSSTASESEQSSCLGESDSSSIFISSDIVEIPTLDITSIDSIVNLPNDSLNSSSDTSSEMGEADNTSSAPSCGDQGHQQGDWPIDHVFMTTSQQPTCLTTGYSRTFCIGCDMELNYEFYPALGHKKVTLGGFDSTCCTHGATGSAYCERCLVVLDEPEELPFSDHVYYEGCCKWCDLTILKFAHVKHDFEDPYAICLGPEKYARRVIIPAEATIMDEKGNRYTYEVKEIAEWAFAGHNELYSIEIGENIEKIGTAAFDLCHNLKEVYDKSKTQVTKRSLDENGWISYVVAEDDFHYEPFESRISYTETGCIIYTNEKESVLIGCRNTHNTVIIPEGVTKISAYVFELCDFVTEVIIASTVQYIEAQAFYYECATHYDDIQHHFKCKSPIYYITFLNPNNWYVWEYNEECPCDPTKMPYDLSESSVAWYQLVVLRDQVWYQEEFLLNHSIENA